MITSNNEKFITLKILSMFENIETIIETKFASGGMKFFVNGEGLVRSDDGMDLGHLEECLEE